jgi:hypothetical protein
MIKSTGIVRKVDEVREGCYSHRTQTHFGHRRKRRPGNLC